MDRRQGFSDSVEYGVMSIEPVRLTEYANLGGAVRLTEFANLGGFTRLNKLNSLEAELFHQNKLNTL
jgi:hypothetical protein